MSTNNSTASGDAENIQGNQSRVRIQTQVDEIPSWNIIILSALQLMMTNLSSMVAVAYMVYTNICAGDKTVLFAELISITLVMSGICTLIQVAVGNRLPILQGSSCIYIPVITAMMSTPRWRCPTQINNNSWSNNTNGTDPGDTEPYLPRLLQLSGSLAVASSVQLVLGLTGIIGCLTQVVGPITVITIMTLIGITLFDLALPGMSIQWGISLLCIALFVLFSVVLDRIHIPFPAYTRSRGVYTVKYPVFKFFPSLLSLGLSWLLCYVMTLTDVFPNDPHDIRYKARTDVKLEVFNQTKWFFLPYPGMWGTPTVGVGTFVGMLGATMSSTLESIGDYYATARVCDLPPPPQHAMNRGIAAEGVGSVLSALMGACHATTSYSHTVGMIQITGVTSRVVWYVYGALMVAFGVCGKFGAALSIIPEPIICATTTLSLGLITAFGLALVKTISVSSRNLVILAISIMTGIILPHAVKHDLLLVQTGNVEMDGAISIVLTTGLLVGGVVSLILDIIIPGSKVERGMTMPASPVPSTADDKMSMYDIPFWSNTFKGVKVFEYVPIAPNYKQPCTSCRCRRLCKSSKNISDSSGNINEMNISATLLPDGKSNTTSAQI